MLTLAERFWKKVAKSNECWVWTGGRLCGRYGRIRYLRGDVWTHEYAYRVLSAGEVRFSPQRR